MSALKGRLRRVLPNGEDDPGKRSFKLIVFFSIGILIVMVVSSIIAFFLTIEGEEQTLVPNVLGMELENAMIELQQKGLVADVELKISANPGDKGTVLNQDPRSGALVKVGRTVRLRVSKGPIIDEVEDYVGMQLSELKLQLQSMSTIYGALIKIRQPVIEVYDDAPPGTILEQKPLPGTKVTELTQLELVVSRGPQGALVTTPDYVGMSIYQALQSCSRRNAPFVFSSRPATEEEVPGTVVSQSPAAGADVPDGTLMQFIVSEPKEVPEGYVFDILTRELPEWPLPMDLHVEIISPEGDRRTLLRMVHPGGAISIPYIELENSVIVVRSSERDLIRQTIRRAAAES